METERDLGVDFHSNRFTVDYFEGAVHKKKTYELKDRQTFYEGLRQTDTLTCEAMTGIFAFCREIGERVGTINIVNPVKFYAGKGNRNKTDSIDARILAEAGRGGRHNIEKELHRVTLVSVSISELRSLVNLYHKQTVQMTMMKNSLHAILKENLCPFNGKDLMSKEVRMEIESLPLALAYRMEINSLFRTIDHHVIEREAIAEEIRKFAKLFEGQVKLLISIPGVSILIALTIISDFGGDLSRFKNQKHFCSYLRTAPMIDQSNDSRKIKHINKCSRPAALGMLLQGLPHVYKEGGKYWEFMERKKKEGKKPGIIRIAIARKIFVAIFHMLKNNALFDEVDMDGYQRKLKELKKYL